MSNMAKIVQLMMMAELIRAQPFPTRPPQFLTDTKSTLHCPAHLIELFKVLEHFPFFGHQLLHQSNKEGRPDDSQGPFQI